MTRAERIVELDLLLQELKVEQRIATWLEARTSVTIWSGQGLEGGAHFLCRVSQFGATIAQGKGASEADARAQAFSVIFNNEATEQAAS